VDSSSRGRTFWVVKSHALLDAIDDLSATAKEDARKLLSSELVTF
jgi:hypothetical protein